jgi:Asp-tRNA(Asn)/Glu-tRNA(Gln) amidotransferase A subunit family amidase
MKKKIRETAEEILQEYTPCYSEVDEDCIVNMLNRLASDVAREIFAEMEKTIRGILILIPFSYKDNLKTVECKKECYQDFLGYIAEAKKKYESEGER